MCEGKWTQLLLEDFVNTSHLLAKVSSEENLAQNFPRINQYPKTNKKFNGYILQ